MVLWQGIVRLKSSFLSPYTSRRLLESYIQGLNVDSRASEIKLENYCMPLKLPSGSSSLVLKGYRMIRNSN